MQECTSNFNSKASTLTTQIISHEHNKEICVFTYNLAYHRIILIFIFSKKDNNSPHERSSVGYGTAGLVLRTKVQILAIAMWQF